MNLTLLTFLLNLIQSIRSIDRSHSARGKFTVHSTNDKYECKNISVIHVVIYVKTHATCTQHKNRYLACGYMIQICITNNICEWRKKNQWPLFCEKKIRYIVILSHEYLFIVCLFAYTHNVLLLLFVCLFVSHIFCCSFFVQIGFHVNRKASGFNFENAFLIG